MKGGGYYTFELNKKLQPHRMGDVIDGRNIEKLKSIYINIRGSISWGKILSYVKWKSG